MTKLKTYLKPFIPGVICALLLLFVQALCDLNLPNLMSDIVNVGLQQSGIENAAPSEISPEGLAMMTAYMEPEDAELVSVLYARVEGEENYKLIRRSPRLDYAFGCAAYNLISVLQSLFADSEAEAPESGALAMEIDLQTLYRIHESIQKQKQLLPHATLHLTAGILANEATLRQTGAMFAKAFYEEIGVDTRAIQTKYILRIGLYMLLITLLGGASAVFVGYLAPRVAAGAARNLRRDIFYKVECFSQNEFDKFSSASLITRCTNDVSQVQMLVGMGIRMMCYAPIMGVGGIIMALRKSVSMSWIIAVAVIVLIGFASIIITIVMPKFKIIQQLIDKLNKVSREILSGLMVIRAFGTEKHERNRFDAANSELRDVNLFVQRVMAAAFPAITFIMNGATLLIVWVGANMIVKSSLQVGDMLAFMQYAMHIIFSFMMIVWMLVLVPRAAVSGERIAEVLKTEPVIGDPENFVSFGADAKGEVEFDNVDFRYGNAEEDVLSKISFTAKIGQTTAIIGATGAGKTTVVNLLLRFYDVTGGSIKIDGVDIRAVRQADLRRRIGYVPQKAALFTKTVGENIRYGKTDAPEEEVEASAAVAQAMDFIEENNERYDYEIAQGGANVSGGQKQRLSIARAIVRKPDILVFDDSFSALDFKTDAALRKALRAHTGDSTVIVVAQRVGTVMNAEQIIVLNEGKIAGRGTHAQLLKECPEYYEIASSQLAERIGTANESGAEV